jgi:hypothetical protein
MIIGEIGIDPERFATLDDANELLEVIGLGEDADSKAEFINSLFNPGMPGRRRGDSGHQAVKLLSCA